MTTHNKFLLSTVATIGLSTLLVGLIIFAFTEPSSSPPTSTVPAPINVGGTTQTFQDNKILKVKSDGTGILSIEGGLNVKGIGVFEGNVGIGTPGCPTGKLDVRGGIAYFNQNLDTQRWATAVTIPINSANFIDSETSPNRSMRLLQWNSGTGGYGGGISWGMAPQSDNTWLSGKYSTGQFLLAYDGSNLKIQGSNQNPGGTPTTFAPSDFMTISNSGNVGIGTTNPQAKLHVRGVDVTNSQITNTADVVIEDHDTATLQIIGSSGTSHLLLSHDNHHWSINNWASFSNDLFTISRRDSASDEWNFGTISDWSHYFAITPNGNVGIGTTAPTSPLTVQLGGTATAQHQGVAVYNTGYWGGFVSKVFGTTYYSQVFPLSQFVRARGTQSSPAAVLSGDILGGFLFDGYYSASAESFDNTEVGAVTTQNWSSSAMGSAITFGATPDNSISKVEIMRVTGNGNVGIGTTNPQGKLDVNGPIYQRGSQLHADYVFEPSYKLETIEDHAKYMWGNKHLEAVPSIKFDENGKVIIEIGALQKGILEELEKAHIYIQQLNEEVKNLEERVKFLEEKIKE